jgi:hypothetical protein
MLDQQRETFFIHIPKTGGNSIESAHGFRQNRVRLNDKRPTVVCRHFTYGQMIRYVDKMGDAAPTTIFTVVRNVFHRLPSTYRHFFRSYGETFAIDHEQYTFSRYVNAIQRYFEHDNVRVEKNLIYFTDDECTAIPRADKTHIERLSFWLPREAEKKCIFLSFENLQSDYISLITPLTGIRNLPHLNQTPVSFSILPTIFDKKSLEIVSHYYCDEIDAFNMKAPDVV